MQIINPEQFNITIPADKFEEYLFICDGSKQFNVTISLENEGATARVYGLFLGSKDDMCDVQITVNHMAPHTTSEILVIGTLDDSAKAHVRGQIHIAPGAYGSIGREDIRTLLLSHDASIRAIPELKIENNDVQCSHAVSTTHIDDEKKFYLESRGLNEPDANQAVIQGHFAPLLEKITDENLRKKVEHRLPGFPE